MCPGNKSIFFRNEQKKLARTFMAKTNIKKAKVIKKALSGKEIRAKSLCSSTLQSYERLIRSFVDYLEETEEDIEYLSDGYLVKSLSGEIIDEMCATLIVKVPKESKGTKKGKTDHPVYKSASSFNSITAALRYWYKLSADRQKDKSLGRIALSEEDNEILKSFGRGQKRLIAEQRALGLMPSREGKRPLSVSGYKFLAKKALADNTSENTANLVHCFTLLSWNLMARSVSVSDLLWNNIGWDGDALSILYEKSKTNQEGEKMLPRFVYANPIEPLICPVLALGIKVCSETPATDEVFKVFSGGSGNTRFSEWLNATLKPLDKDQNAVAQLENSPIDFGTHSLRKGSATYVCGITGGPDSDSVKLRMEHSIGSTDDRYIYRQAGSDKYVGRAVSVLPPRTADFTMLPPHFIDPTFKVDEVISSNFLNMANNSLKSALPFLVASVIYHWNFICKNLPANHPFFNSVIYTHNYQRKWGDLVRTGLNEDLDCQLLASGVPNSILVLKKMSDSQEELRRENADLKATLKLLIDAIRENPKLTCDFILKKVSSVGDIKLHDQDVVASIVESKTKPMMEQLAAIDETLKKVFEDKTEKRSNNENGPEGEDEKDLEKDSADNPPLLIKHLRAVHPVPNDFRFPTCKAVDMWRLWIYGKPINGLDPFHLLSGKLMRDSKDPPQFSKASKVMEAIREKIGLSWKELRRLKPHDAEDKFNDVFEEIFEGGSNLNCSSLYKLLERPLKSTKKNPKNNREND